MIPRTRLAVVFCAGLALLLVIADSASAQRGRRGFMVYSPAELSSLPEVQADLKFNADQQMKADGIFQQFQSDRRALFQGGGFSEDNFEELGRKIRELKQDASVRLLEMLDPQQQVRLQQILIQANGPAALTSPDITKELNISDDQQAKLEEIPQKIWPAIRESVNETQTDEERQKIISDIRAKSEEEMLAVLTPQQREQFKAMQGKPIELDLDPLRPRWGRRGRD